MFVIGALDPAIHQLPSSECFIGYAVKPAHDESEAVALTLYFAAASRSFIRFAFFCFT
jgi:hypothetical protein